MFTNLDFVSFVLAVYAARWVYWYGTCGYKCSTSLYNSKKKQYPSSYTKDRESGYKADIDNKKMCADCVGMIKAFFWMGGKIDGANKYGSNNCPDKSANGMFNLCKETGPISTLPDTPGLVVWKNGHIGVYVGDGYTVELMGFAYDCKKKKVSDGSWTKWGKLPESMLKYIDGESVKPVEYKLGERTLQKGDEGTDVAELQTALKGLSYDLGKYGIAKDGVDGDFGSKTQAAVKQLQTVAGLDQTGIFDVPTYKALIDAQNPQPVDEPDTDTPDNGSTPSYVLVIEGDEETLRAIYADHGGTLATSDDVQIVFG